MGRMGGFRYRDIVRRPKQFGFEFDRQATGSHEIWFSPRTNRYTTVPNHQASLANIAVLSTAPTGDVVALCDCESRWFCAR